MEIKRLLELAGTKLYGSEDENMMRRAISQANKASRLKCEPIGCIIVSSKGEIIAEGHNECDLHNDPTAHGEIITIRKACKSLKSLDLHGATLYSTLQPCGMCTMAAYWANIGRIVYGATDDTVDAKKYFETENIRTQQIINDMHRTNLIPVASGVLISECSKLYSK